jgi:hypothetical protein
MERKTATIDEILATFSSHIEKHYPSPKNFRRNFSLLLKGKRARSDEGGYSVSLERNIVFLGDLVAAAEALAERLLGSEGDDAAALAGISSKLQELEEKAHKATAQRHREAFIEGTASEFRELRGERSAGGAAYVDKLEFHYRYLMTLRIFLFEFVSVLAAIRSEYSVSGLTAGVIRKIRNHLEVTAHYYLGNVAVGGEDINKPVDGG